MLTEAEVAALLKLSANTLRSWRSQGKGPPFRKLGRLVRYRAEDLDAWVCGGSPPTNATDAKAGTTGPSASSARRVQSNGTRPTLEQVTDYVQAVLLKHPSWRRINPTKFLAYYDGNGWVQGDKKKPIKNWKAAVITWMAPDELELK